jgi:hypothetical protein
MPTLSEITYSREKCIAAIRDYYSFLVKMYLDEAQIINPPESGWPHITPENLQDFGKIDEIFTLFRHLPYIRELNNREQAQGAPNCEFADWETISMESSEGHHDSEYLRAGTESYELFESVPPHVVSITRGSDTNDVFLVDTKLGIIH